MPGLPFKYDFERVIDDWVSNVIVRKIDIALRFYYWANILHRVFKYFNIKNFF